MRGDDNGGFGRGGPGGRGNGKKDNQAKPPMFQSLETSVNAEEEGLLGAGGSNRRGPSGLTVAGRTAGQAMDLLLGFFWVYHIVPVHRLPMQMQSYLPWILVLIAFASMGATSASIVRGSSTVVQNTWIGMRVLFYLMAMAYSGFVIYDANLRSINFDGSRDPLSFGAFLPMIISILGLVLSYVAL